MGLGIGMAAICLCAPPGTWAALQHEVEEPFEVTVSFEENTEGEILAWAKLTVSRIPEPAGVRIRWKAQPRAGGSGCATATVRTPNNFEPGAWGVALPYAVGRQHVTVFLDRLRPALKTGGPAAGSIVGHVIAHELVDALGIARRSDEGLMRARWSPDDFLHMQIDPLPLTAHDIGLIRRRLERCSTLADKAEQ